MTLTEARVLLRATHPTYDIVDLGAGFPHTRYVIESPGLLGTTVIASEPTIEGALSAVNVATEGKTAEPAPGYDWVDGAMAARMKAEGQC